MRFYKDKKTRPSSGSTRRVTKFLCFPKRIDGETRWLETATWEEEWGVPVFDEGYGPRGFWCATRWVNYENE